MNIQETQDYLELEELYPDTAPRAFHYLLNEWQLSTQEVFNEVDLDYLEEALGCSEEKMMFDKLDEIADTRKKGNKKNFLLKVVL